MSKRLSAPATGSPRHEGSPWKLTLSMLCLIHFRSLSGIGPMGFQSRGLSLEMSNPRRPTRDRTGAGECIEGGAAVGI